MRQGGPGNDRPVRVLVTGGGTVAPIDEVRQITNVSTGSFSAQLTESLLSLGAEVWHVHSPNAQQPLGRLANFDLATSDPEAETARLRAIHNRWRQQAPRLHMVPLPRGTVAEYELTLYTVLTQKSIDLAFLAMAVSDYEPLPQEGKLSSDQPEMTLTCHRTPKVIRSVRSWAPRVFLVGFKLLVDADFAELVHTAREACRVNQADLTVANDLNTLRAGRHTIHLVDPAGEVQTLGPEPPPAHALATLVLEKWAAAHAK